MTGSICICIVVVVHVLLSYVRLLKYLAIILSGCKVTVHNYHKLVFSGLLMSVALELPTAA